MRWREARVAVVRVAAVRSVRGFGLAVAIVAGFLGLGAPGAAADCSGPTISYDAGPVDRGQAITVTGGGFGDNCYDTGPPPPGEGILGRPLAEIDVVISQAGVEHVVAEGSADDDYELTVEVVVPAELAPGEARLQVRWGPGSGWAVDQTDQALVVSDAAATGGADEIATFGPGAETGGEGEGAGAAPSDGNGDDGGSAGESRPARWLVAGVVVAAVLGVGSMVVVRQR